MIKKTLILLVGIFYYLPNSAQNIDSLKSIAFSTELNINDRTEALILLTKKFERTKPDSALIYIKLLSQLHKGSNDYNQLVSWLNTEVSILITLQDFEEAGVVLNTIQEYVDNQNVAITSDLFLNKGSLALSQRKLDTALVNYLNGLDLLDENADGGSKLKFYNNIAIIYMQLQQPKKAQEYMELAIQSYDKDDVLKLNLLTNLGSLYQNNREYSKAEVTLKEAERLGLLFKNERVLATIYGNLSAAYQELEDFDISIEYGLKGLALKRKGGFGGKQFTLNNLGYTYMLKEDYANAVKYLNEALSLASGADRMQILHNLKNANRAWGKHELAIEQFELYNELKDSLNALSYDSRIAEINEKYQNEKKEKEIALLSSENQLQKSSLRQQQYLLIAVIIFALLIVFIGYLLYHQNRIKRDLEEAVIQQKFLRTQLNPHFLFNALTGIQHFLFKNDAEKSIEYLSYFSTLMREVLETSDQDWVPLDREVNLLRSYLKLQEINHPLPFNYEIVLDEELNTEQIKIPTMLIQPFIENALIHGLKDLAEGHVKLFIHKESEHMKIIVMDNGKGMSKAYNQAGKGMYKSMSSDIIVKRIALIKKKFAKIASLNIDRAYESEERPGTKVTIDIPLVYNEVL